VARLGVAAFELERRTKRVADGEAEQRPAGAVADGV